MDISLASKFHFVAIMKIIFCFEVFKKRAVLLIRDIGDVISVAAKSAMFCSKEQRILTTTKH